MLSFGLFLPLTANAEEYTSFKGTYKFSNQYYYANGISHTLSWTSGEYASGGASHSSFLFDGNEILLAELVIERGDGNNIAKAGDSVSVVASNLMLNIVVNGATYQWFTCENLQLVAIYTDGSYGYVTDDVSFTYSSGKVSHTLKGKFTADKDVSKLKFNYRFSPYRSSGISGTYSATFGIFMSPASVSVSIPSEEAGLLDGILGWCKNIFNKVEESWAVMSAGFANIGTWFSELPGKLWDVMSEGLKSLFVPDEEYITGYKDKWDELLSSRLGAVYQVVNVIDESWSNIQNADQINTISMPSVTIPLPNGNSFSFGGYDVKIVPDRFDVLVTALKSIIGIVCTAMFINGLKSRYDEVMGTKG